MFDSLGVASHLWTQKNLLNSISTLFYKLTIQSKKGFNDVQKGPGSHKLEFGRNN